MIFSGSRYVKPQGAHPGENYKHHE